MENILRAQRSALDRPEDPIDPFGTVEGAQFEFQQDALAYLEPRIGHTGQQSTNADKPNFTPRNPKTGGRGNGK
mgnify:CR=1 FL=1